MKKKGPAWLLFSGIGAGAVGRGKLEGTAQIMAGGRERLVECRDCEAKRMYIITPACTDCYFTSLNFSR